MVDCHLSQAGYRVALAADAESGLRLAESRKPDLIILDHQLPGITGDEVCRKLLAAPATAEIPILVSSALRSRAFARYSDFPNVIDQLPKPFTADLLRSGVDNALQTGEMVVKAQREGLLMPESVEAAIEASLEGDSSVFPLKALIDFLTSSNLSGRLIVESGRDRIKFSISAGKIQAVYSPTISPIRLIEYLPEDLVELAPLIAVSLAEQRNPSMSGLLKLLESSLNNAARIRSLLLFQSSILTYFAFKGEPGRFSFDAHRALPPLFQACPLQSSLAALAVEGTLRMVPEEELTLLSSLVFGRTNLQAGSADRSGLKPTDLSIYSALDGARPLSAIADKLGLMTTETVAVALGLELTGQVERRCPVTQVSVLLLESNSDNAMAIKSALSTDTGRFHIRQVRDRLAAKLLLRRTPFHLIILSMESDEDESFYQSLKEVAAPETRFLGVVKADDETRGDTLSGLGLDAVVIRPIAESELKSSVNRILQAGEPVGV